VLTFGGFSGNDDVVLVEDLSEMAADGELRYILGMPQQKPDIAIWVAENCTIVDVPGVVEKRQAPKFDGQGEDVLFDCGEG